MKKVLFFAILACMFVSCSSDGSREIQIDEVKFVQSGDYPIEQYSKVSSIFEVVPGKYTISWRLVDDAPRHKNYNVELKMKLRLKKTVEIFPETYDDLETLLWPWEFELTDANGKPLGSQINGISVAINPAEEWRTNDLTNKDGMMDFLNFIGSTPGTEIEVVCNTMAFWDPGLSDVPELIKSAKGVQCVMEEDDNYLERRIGVIK